MRLETEPGSLAGPGAATGCRAFAGRLAATAFCLVFFGAGSLFTSLVIREVLRAAGTYRWPTVTATILSSGVETVDDDEEPYRAAVTYRYQAAEGLRTSDRLARSTRGSASWQKAARRAGRYPRGAAVTCYVNPADPEESVLERGGLLAGLVLPLPLVFVAVGAGGLYLTWRRTPPRPAATAISTGARARQVARIAPLVLGGVFTAVGGGLFVAIGAVPGLRLLRAASWPEVPCTVVSSTLRAHSSDDGTTYRVDILYEYRVAGQSWRSNRLHFANFGSSGWRAKRAVVDSHPAGSRTVCYVDPADPTEAVLDRSLRAAYLVGLAPLVFLLAGVAVLRWGLGRGRTAGEPATGAPEPSSLTPSRSPAVLTPRVTAGGKLLGSVVVAVFWNGIVAVFLHQLVSEWLHGNPQWFMALFLAPFVVVGAVLVGAVGYFALAVLNPRPRLTLTPGTPRLGDTLHVQWRFAGRTGRIRRLRVSLEGREEITSARGDSSHTEREVFAKLTGVDTGIALGIARGEVAVTIPEDTMHSFSGDHNRVVWTVRMSGEIPGWPDVDDEFPVEVRPRDPEGGWR